MLRCHTPIAFSLKMNKQFSSQFKYWPIILAVLFGAIFCSKTPKNNQFSYIPQDYYPVKIEYIDAPDEIKFSTDLEWADFVNSWNLSKADEQPIENWVFRLTFGHVFPEKVPSRASKGKKRSIEVIVGENTILVDGIYYSCPDNKKLIELLVARWNRAPLID